MGYLLFVMWHVNNVCSSTTVVKGKNCASYFLYISSAGLVSQNLANLACPCPNSNICTNETCLMSLKLNACSSCSWFTRITGDVFEVLAIIYSVDQANQKEGIRRVNLKTR